MNIDKARCIFAIVSAIFIIMFMLFIAIGSSEIGKLGTSSAMLSIFLGPNYYDGWYDKL